MANGKMLNELRELYAKGELDNNTAIHLMLAEQEEVRNMVQENRTDIGKILETVENLWHVMEERKAEDEKRTEELKKAIADGMKAAEKDCNKYPSLLALAAKYPLATYPGAGAAAVLVSAFYIAEVRTAILEALGVTPTLLADLKNGMIAVFILLLGTCVAGVIKYMGKTEK